MTATPLEGLIEAMAGAVVEAQARIEQAQVARLGDYFDDDNRPKSVIIRMPSMQPGSRDGDEDLYRAPILPLVPSTSLRIKDVEICFDAELGPFHDEDPSARGVEGVTDVGESRWAFLSKVRKRSVALDTTARRRDNGLGKVQVKLRVEGVDPSDGVARLANHLAMTQGVFQTFRPGD
ncbi:DUF2589 domain-containing protein [Luteibacter aegosomatissinici]|uniref:DUF2589 domain-containing protein n=1 Tax=Luteibacter aegosomatissinici TaxID=2911539 RepID=UPI001FF82E14|nr:DUF2589 domain-containing protein [Luteibacter aegosomatissinici]UPG94992.1 DUF2589 domain-containing protein [Luteibacter aegosomatissinici]